MDTKRLSLSNLHEQIDSLRSSEWPTMKRYLRRYKMFIKYKFIFNYFEIKLYFLDETIFANV